MAKLTPETKALNLLAYEFDPADVPRNDKKLRRNIGPKVMDALPSYWLSDLRALTNDVRDEVSKHERSRYHNGKQTPFASLEQFEIEQMRSDYRAKYPRIAPGVVEGFVSFAIYLYYLR